MKIAIIGSRSIKSIDLNEYVTDNDEIVSGGARGIDTLTATCDKAGRRTKFARTGK